MAKKKIKVLFFIAGTRATEAEEEAMLQFNVKHVVCLRNASMIRDGDHIEDFDKVAGEVPPAYAEAAKLKKPEPEAPKPPKAKAEKVDQRSPAAPPPAGQEGAQGNAPPPPEGAQTGAEGNQGDNQQPPADPPVEAPAGDQTKPEGGAAPKKPEPNPGAGKGWKPNA